ncbi:Abi family protein [Candidatus Parcubacteria bacterium]|nr:MAG: Abi family protein [Candidatus Parcubacteria bacterium]
MRSFSKPPLSIPEQIALLKRRGLTIQNEARAASLFEVISLFRLTPYMRPFQRAGDPEHRFFEGITLHQIIRLYRFDQALRNLMMDSLERVEVGVRAVLGNAMAVHYGDAHWYMNPGHFRRNFDHDRLLDEIRSKLDKERSQFHKEVDRITNSRVPEGVKRQRIEQRKRDNYFRYYAETYNLPPLPPSWAVMEELSFGTVSRLYKGLAKDVDRKMIARRFNLPHQVLGSWLHTLTFVRNICAHHARLWNRELPIPPKLPKSSEWHWPPLPKDIPHPERRLFVILLMLAYLMRHIGPDSRWQTRLEQLLADYPDIPMSPMGLYPSWQTHPVWRNDIDAE